MHDKRERCYGEHANGKQCRRRVRLEGEYVTRMEAWVDRRLYCDEHAREWEAADPNGDISGAADE